jgi:hypothetical protein
VASITKTLVTLQARLLRASDSLQAQAWEWQAELVLWTLDYLRNGDVSPTIKSQTLQLSTVIDVSVYSDLV